ncbi:Protein C9orf78, putative [Chondrus crispus]|uniref:Protein C9orf78, putative n=1 Tax=Chondrus crispus TaxID=2769 RepID=R7Q4X6_CHOCR|nr:Protein C9orf78, putative [Chondrus crispus]CDF32485.1 Protein C9orf78, putative [Chondrus crispus]|eukprot:XP_005712150.1 Protein C9orf78, putative [Chondrus crispus]
MSSEIPADDKETAVRLRRRTKSTKKRAKRVLDDEVDTPKNLSNSEKEMTAAELLLMRKAQQMREESRKIALDITGGEKRHRDGEKTEKANPSSVDNVISDLKDDFAVERSGHDMEERMEKFINDGMKKKFGDKDDHTITSARDGNTADEFDLFAVPERLKVEQRPQYDPGDGLPAAGVEEVELPEDVRQRNIEETVRAHRKLLEKRDERLSTPILASIPGNVSANYSKHRSDWIAEHVGPKGHDSGNEPVQNISNVSGDGKGKVRDDTVKRPRYQAATDYLVADRFKKRWRR